MRSFDLVPKAIYVETLVRGSMDQLWQSTQVPEVHGLAVDDRGGLCIRSGAQRFYEGPIAFTFPTLFSGVADVCEWYEDATQRFRIDVNVHNRRWGPLFGYHGWFHVEWKPITPQNLSRPILPLREERRE